MKYVISIDLAKVIHPLGTLEVIKHSSGRKYLFTYDHAWLSASFGFSVEPQLELSPYSVMLDELPSFLLDASPDFWGKKIMDRHPCNIGKQLTALDYLLGVDDALRLGAIRLSSETSPNLFLASSGAVPPMVELEALEQACLRVETMTASAADLHHLLGPGASMGGARPKAVVQDGSDLYIAKFKSTSDVYRVACWEAVSLALASLAGIKVNEFKLLGKNSPNPVLLVKRFDRHGSVRIPFASALTMGHYLDVDNVSYAEIGATIQLRSASPRADVYEWWLRMVFNGLIGNTDDHLRNHGFLRFADGWHLSPTFDLNPSPSAPQFRYHVLAFMPRDPCQASLRVFTEVGQYLGISDAHMKLGYHQIGSALAQWRPLALQYGLTDSEINYFAPAFEHEDSHAIMATSRQKPLSVNFNS